MFTYTLSGKTIENGRNRITVDYTNGTVKCTETFFFSSKEDLDTHITEKLAQLENVVTLDASINEVGYVKSEKAAPDESSPLKVATATLYELKRLIDLGVMKEDDPEFIAAVSAYKAAASGK